MKKMVQRYQVQVKKGDSQVEDYEALAAMVCPSSGFCNYKTRARPKLLYLLFLSLLSCCLVLVPNIFGSSSAFSLLYSCGGEYKHSLVGDKASLCSLVSNGTICCDRTSRRTDICIMKGDVRTHSVSSSIFLYKSRKSAGRMKHGSSAIVEDEGVIQLEKIKPYTRKWEKDTMGRVGELDLVLKRDEFRNNHSCDVKHDVPAVFFSTSGYTGNLYHEFNDGILPLYITSRQFEKNVVFVIQEYHDWWIMKYGDILSQLSAYPAIDFSGDKRTHCFPEAIVGLRIHGELTVDPSLMQGNMTIFDFRELLDRAYWPRINDFIEEEDREAQQPQAPWSMPKLVILSRNGSRAITNEDLLVKMAKEIGYSVEIVRPDPTTELAKIYQSLNSSDVMIGVHGAAMTHLLFMRPGSVFIQVVPLGTEWAAEKYYGEPAKNLGLKYIGYQILPQESSLYDEYDKDDPVLQDPDSVSQKGWEYTKSIYLDRQKVKLSLGRFQKWLLRAYRYSVSKRSRQSRLLRMH